MLAGNSYRFRYVAPVNYNSSTGAITEVVAAEGVINFLSGGTYTIAQGSTFIDNTENSGKPQEFPVAASTSAAGTYGISAAGIGYISSPLAVINTCFEGAYEYGTYTDGIFTGSATEFGLNDLFVMIKPGAPPTNSTFTSPYWLGSLNFSGGTDQLLKNALVEINPNGSGGLGTLNISGQTFNQGGNPLTQTVTGATYNFAADGGATLTIPLPSGVTAANALFTATGANAELMYVSADGNFVLGWNPNGFDIVFGVRALTGAYQDSQFSGLYYLGNLSDIPEQCGAESYWGSELSYGNESEVIHQRLLSQACSYTGAVTDFGTDDYTGLETNGIIDDALGNIYGFGASENAFVAIGSGGYYSLTIGIHAPSLSASGVFVNPTGVLNAASWDPVTASFAPGELFTLYGTGLASSTLANAGGTPFGTSLGTTQVLVNGEPAPIYDISPTKIDAIMPYATADSTTGYGTIQVNNGGLLSNQVQVYLTDAESGIFSQGEDGIGEAIAEHANGSFVTENNPAQPGETIVLALTGMGTVTPAITDGALGPSGPLSYADVYTNTTNCTATTPNCNLLVLFNDYINNSTQQQATVAYAGLYPGLAGLYQMNVTVPTTVGPGDVYIEVVTDAADVEQVTIPVSGVSAAAKIQPRQALPVSRTVQRALARKARKNALTSSARPRVPVHPAQ